MAVLAVSEQAEQAVVTSTLILWRSLGMVMGVSVSSLVMQNALVVYLNQKVVGPEKEKVCLFLNVSIWDVLTPHRSSSMPANLFKLSASSHPSTENKSLKHTPPRLEIRSS